MLTLKNTFVKQNELPSFRCTKNCGLDGVTLFGVGVVLLVAIRVVVVVGIIDAEFPTEFGNLVVEVSVVWILL